MKGLVDKEEIDLKRVNGKENVLKGFEDPNLKNMR